jgi:2-methylcitrate dehydratase PrpD
MGYNLYNFNLVIKNIKKEFLMVNNVTGTLAKFSAELKYNDLPENVIHEIKRGILDLTGLALGSLELDKGRIAVELARKIGGNQEATVLGTGEKVAAPIAAFANGELMHSMDYNAILPPMYIGPFVTPATLAIAESRKASGKNFILALTLANEIASRIGVSLGSFRSRIGEPVRSYGVGFDTFGAAIGAGKIMGFDSVKMSDAMGLAGYFAPVPCHTKYMNTANNGIMKFGAAGWTAQGGVTAAMLAEIGERGDRSVLDGDYGFWAMNGSRSCNWESITKNLGKEWNVLQAKYKSLPCDGVFQSPLMAFMKMIKEHDLKPQEIEQVLVKTELIGQSPQFMSLTVENNVDASMCFPYNIAVAAHRIKVGPVWQAHSTFENPSILEFMKKVKFDVYPWAEESRHQEIEVEGKPYINRRPSLVEVTARGKVFKQDNEFVKWLSVETPGFKATDEDLIEKFKVNAEAVLKGKRLQAAIDKIMNLEQVGDVNELIKTLIR